MVSEFILYVIRHNVQHYVCSYFVQIQELEATLQDFDGNQALLQQRM